MRFKEWFNQVESGVLSFDDHVYHGSPDTSIRDLAPYDGDCGFGYYFTKNRQYANSYITYKGKSRVSLEDEGKLYIFRLKLNRAIDAHGWHMKPEEYRIYREMFPGKPEIDINNPADNNWPTLRYYLGGRRASDLVKMMGYDGVIDRELDEILAFEPKSFRLLNPISPKNGVAKITGVN